MTKRAASLATLLLLAACAKQAPPPPPPPTVSVAPALQRDVRDWDEYVGRFEAIQDVEIRPRVSGQVTQILFKDGQNVRQGQPLFVIDPRPYRAQLAQAQAQVTSAQATLANAGTELNRAQSLVGQQAISREEFETRQAGQRTAAASLAAARAAVTARALDVSFTTVTAPVSGRVSDRRVSRGDYVTAGTDVLTRVVTVDPIWFRFEGAESFYLKYLRQDRAGTRRSSRAAGNPVEIGLADEPGFRWRGRMNFVDNAIDPNSGTISAHAEVPNPGGFLTPGMFGRARLLGSGTYRALLVPDEVITTDQTRRIVLVVGRDNKVAQREVSTGPMVEGLRVIREGLAPTDLIILNGSAQLQPGSPVSPKRTQLKPRAVADTPVEAESAPPAAAASAAR